MKGLNRLKLRKTLIGALCVLASHLACAETVADAKALQETALNLIKAKGLDAAVKEFNAGGLWSKGSLYVTVAQFDGMMLAHSQNDKVAGKNMLQIKDVSGKMFVQDAIATVKANGNAQLDLRWGNPVTKQISDAVLVARRIPDHDAYISSMVFK